LFVLSRVGLADKLADRDDQRWITHQTALSIDEPRQLRRCFEVGMGARLGGRLADRLCVSSILRVNCPSWKRDRYRERSRKLRVCGYRCRRRERGFGDHDPNHGFAGG
jgi:hypothetical protein